MTTKINKSLLESISKIVNSDSKNLTESYSYINKKNHKASNTDQLEDLIAAELDLGGVDDEDLETMLDLFKKGYDIAVSVERDGTASELKKDGYTIGNFAIYKNEAAKRQQIFVKAPAGMKDESKKDKKDLEEAFNMDAPIPSSVRSIMLKRLKDFEAFLPKVKTYSELASFDGMEADEKTFKITVFNSQTDR